MPKKEIDILIIEDSPTDTELLMEKVKDFKVFNCQGRVKYTKKIKEAEAMLAERDFDAILLDLNLPDSRGIDSLKRIINIKKKAAVIIMTALSEQEVITEALNLGAQNYIVKGEESPVSLERAVMYSMEREKNIREIKKFQKLQEEIINNSPVMMFLLDDKGGILQTNPEALSFLNLKKTGIKGSFNGRVFDCVNSFKSEKGCGFSEDCGECPLRALLNDSLTSGRNEYKKEIRLDVRKAGGNEEKFLLVSIKTMGDADIPNYLVSVEDVTSFRIAENRIRESEKKFSDAFFSSPVGLLISRRDTGKILECNKIMKVKFGYENSDFIGKTTIELGLWADLKDRQKVIDTIETGGTVANVEALFRKKNGDPVLCLYSCEKIIVDNRDCALSTFVDITEFKKTQEALVSSEKKFSAAFFSSPLVMMITRLSDGKILELNGKVLKISGYERAELVGKTTVELNLWPSAEDRKKVVEEIRTKGYVPELELNLLAKSGKLVPCLFSSNLININGEKCAISIMVDISERIKAQESQAVSEEKFRSAFEQAAVGIAYTAADGTFLNVNEKFCVIVGYKKEEIEKMKFRDLTHPDDRETGIQALKDMISGGIGAYKAEKRYIRKDKSIVWVTLNASLVRNPDGSPKYFVAVIEDITVRKELESGLKEIMTEAMRMRSALDQVPVHVYMKDIQGRYIYANQATLKLFGCPADELIGSNDSSFFSPETVKQIIEKDRRVLNGEKISEESVTTDISGIQRVYYDTKMPIFSDEKDKKPQGLMGISIDITERKRLENEEKFFSEIQSALSQAASAQDVYRIIAEKTGDFIGGCITIVISVDEETGGFRVAAISGLAEPVEKMIKIAGVDFTKLVVGRNEISDAQLRPFKSGKMVLQENGIYSLAVGKIPKIACDTMQKMLNIKTVYSIGFVGGGRHFGSLSILSSGDLKKYAGIIERTVNYAFVVIKRKMAEEALKSSEEKWASFTDSANDILTIWDGRLRLAAANRVAYNEYKAVADKNLELGKSILELGRDLKLPPRYRQFLTLLRSGKPVASEEYSFTDAGGENKSYSFKAFKLADGMGLIISNITELKRSEMILKQSYEKLKEVDRLKSNFISIISHELRTPLTIIKGFTSFLIKEAAGPLNDTQKNFVSTIDINTARLARIINDMVDVSKIESGAFSIEKERHDLVGLISEAVDNMGHIAGENGVSMEKEVEFKNASAEIDKGRMMQTVSNLINNAIRFSKKGGSIWVGLKPADAAAVPARFADKMSEEKNYYFMYVRDEGAGMEKQYLEKIFERFFQVENANVRKHQGAGLGLSIAKNIVEAHAGFIWAESDGLGRGAKICMLLPE